MVSLKSVASAIVPRNKKRFLAKMLDRSGANRLIRQQQLWSGLLVLNYHRVGVATETPFNRNLFSATRDQFDDQIRFLKNSADVVRLHEIEDLLSAPGHRGVLITFDDGYRDNYENAFPILAQHKVPATFFLTTGFLDQPFVPWWDEIAWMVRQSPLNQLAPCRWFSQKLTWSPSTCEQCIDHLVKIYWRLPGHLTTQYLDDLATMTQAGRCSSQHAQSLWMTWTMIKQMVNAGMEVGAHTVTHPILSRISQKEQQQELLESRNRIEQETGICPNSLSYPVGLSDMFTRETMAIAQKLGYRWGFSFHGGYTRCQAYQPMNLNRIGVETAMSTEEFRALVGYPHIFS